MSVSDHKMESRYVGAAMVDPAILRDFPLPLGCFDKQRHREIMEALLSIHGRGDRATQAGLEAELGRLGYGQTAGSDPFALAAFLDDPAAVVVRLRELQTRRTLIGGCRAALRSLESGEPLLSAVAQLRNLAETPDVADEDRTGNEHVRETVASAIEDTMVRYQAKGTDEAGMQKTLIVSGHPTLDKAFGGWDRGDLVVLAGDPNAGKSTTMISMARAQAAAGEKALIVSLEDGKVRWGRRVVSAMTSVPVRALKRCDLTASQWQSVAGLGERLTDSHVWLSFPLGGTLDEVMHTIRRARNAHGISVVYVDYLQAIEGGSDERNMRHHVKDCLSSLRRETARGDAPLTVILGCQYRKREDTTKRPTDGDLYEAAYIHQKADVILHLWRDGQGTRRFAMTKHKDEEGVEGLLLRNASTGLIAADNDTRDIYPSQATPAPYLSGPPPASEFDDGVSW